MDSSLIVMGVMGAIGGGIGALIAALFFKRDDGSFSPVGAAIIVAFIAAFAAVPRFLPADFGAIYGAELTDSEFKEIIDQIESESKTFAAVRDYQPEIWEEMKTDLRARLNAVEPKTPSNLYNSGFQIGSEMSEQIMMTNVPYTSDEALVGFVEVTSEMFLELSDSRASTCTKFMNGARINERDLQVSQDLQLRIDEASAEVIRYSNQSDVRIFSEAELQPVLTPVVLDVAQSLGQRGIVAGSDRYNCLYVVELYGGLLELPPESALPTLRGIFVMAGDM